MRTIVDWEADTSQWSQVLDAAHGCANPGHISDNALWPIYGPLISKSGQQSLVIGQIGQSLDGRIATPSGHSHYINGPAALVHLHRLRALVDAVVVGVGTVIADDPQLSVRRARLRPGKSQPARVIIDPHGRMPSDVKCLAGDGARCIVIGAKAVAGAEHIALAERGSDGLAPADIIAALADLGLARVLIEGGANTLSRFVAAGALQRLHILTGPLIIGSGPPGLTLPAINTLSQALRPAVSAYALPGGDVLFDCAFSRESGS